MSTPTDEKTNVTASPAALEVLALLQESPGVPLVVRMLPAYRRLISAMQAWVIDVERRIKRQECQR